MPLCDYKQTPNTLAFTVDISVLGRNVAVIISIPRGLTSRGPHATPSSVLKIIQQRLYVTFTTAFTKRASALLNGSTREAEVWQGWISS